MRLAALLTALVFAAPPRPAGARPQAHSARSDGARSSTNAPASRCSTVRLAADPVDVRTGDRVIITATVSEPDAGPGPVSFSWSATAGSLEGSGETATLDTTNLIGTVVVSVVVSDGDASCSPREQIVLSIFSYCPPAVVPLEPCMGFDRDDGHIKPGCDAALRDATERMRQDPRTRIAVDGYSGPGERAGVARLRADAVRDILVAHGVAADRIVVRTPGDPCLGPEPERGRRVELYIVPGGKTPDDIITDCPSN